MIFLPLYFFNYTGLLHTYIFHMIGFFFQAHPIDKTTGRKIENYWEPVQVAGGEMMKWPPAPEVTVSCDMSSETKGSARLPSLLI